jgi:hypothetical protein
MELEIRGLPKILQKRGVKEKLARHAREMA